MTRGCTMGVGCQETGICYAAAHGEPDRCDAEDEAWPPDEERYVWHVAFGACPGACGYDGDALVDRATGRAVQWRCSVCGDR